MRDARPDYPREIGWPGVRVVSIMNDRVQALVFAIFYFLMMANKRVRVSCCS